MKIERDKDIYIEDKATKWINEYNEFLDNTRKRQGELDKELSSLDLQEQDILHYIEMRKCDAVTSARLMKKLKEIRIKRRSVKEEHCAIASINSTSKKSNYCNKQKKYKFKTEIIFDLLEDIINE